MSHKRFLLSALTLASSLAALPARAALPTQLSQLPVYPGARPTQLEEGEWEESTLGNAKKPEVKAYLVDASIDEVTRWYAQQLGTKVGAHVDVEPSELKPGTTTPVNNDVYPHSLEDDDDGAGHLLRSKAQKQALLARCRPAFKSGEWTSSSNFDWTRLNANGSRSVYYVNLDDRGVAQDWKSCVKRTRIVLATETSQSTQEAEDAQDQAMQAQLEKTQKELGTKPPTEKELGLPLYPGARYDARASAGMSMNAQRAYLFVTDDAMAKVVKFYEAKLGKKAQGSAETGYMIPLKGQGLVPDEGLAVQQNMLPGGGKTLITVMREKK
ncbi:hypothetical protein FGE12_05385 [Aggregicoccus sp. 17bor-14]|uniref:hypothetical protein n=1 Tax=Myxococcaceae TaxID=31 RepID=UPI00129C294C|nr:MULTISPECIES: hypothetical protein [Myxococcaceae]MBF5041814.1 hypothetical protein [Simulacricoccus sp. 17bor-14]MRI87595.1 hypothetical protein [Aggregicoccus sp. 17bor-14]